MIKGKKIKRISFFDTDHYLGEERDIVTDLDHYFVQYQDTATSAMEVAGLFDSELYFDLLAAPGFVFEKQHLHFEYSPELVTYFFKLFPNAQPYVHLLQEHFHSAIKFLHSFEEHENDPKKILSEYDKLAKHFNEIKQRLDVVHVLKGLPYKEAAKEITDRLIKNVKALTNKLKLTPADVFEHRYYNTHKGLSWSKNPLAFFVHALYDNGYKNIMAERNYDLDRLGEAKNLSYYFNNRYKNEYRRSADFIGTTISKLKRDNRKAYINRICEELNSLYNESLNHPISSLYPNYQLPYKLLVKELQKRYPKSTFPVLFDTKLDNEELPIETVAFQKKLHEFQFKLDTDEKLTLFDNEKIKEYHVGYFIKGQFDKIPAVIFNWPKKVTYYLFKCILDHGASFALREREAERIKKQFLFRDLTICCRDNYYTYIHRLTKLECQNKIPEYTSYIDSLFM